MKNWFLCNIYFSLHKCRISPHYVRKIYYCLVFCVLCPTVRTAFNDVLRKSGKYLVQQNQKRVLLVITIDTHRGLRSTTLKKAWNLGYCITRAVSVIYTACGTVGCVLSCYKTKYTLFPENANVMLHFDSILVSLSIVHVYH